MSSDDRSAQNAPMRRVRARELVLEFARQQKDGIDRSEQSLIDEHKDLQPELGQELEKFRRIESARVQAERIEEAKRKGETPPEGIPASLRYFGDYILEGVLGRGAMGVVYRARQVNLPRIVAVKMMLSQSLLTQDDIDRFLVGVRSAAGLNHPNIVPVYEAGKHEDQHYFSMRLIEGGSLHEAIKNGPLSAEMAARYTRDCALALHYAHQQGVIHRDIKPANILLDRSHGENVPVITDFGLAKQIDSDVSLTRVGMGMGTPGFAPPEQLRGISRAKPTNDVYGLGATLYWLITGKPPHQGSSVFEVVEKTEQEEPIAPRQINSLVGRDLETICLKCLEKSPGKRYESAAALAEDLERYLDGRPIQGRRAGLLERGRHFLNKHLFAVAAALLIGVLAVVTATSFYWGATRGDVNVPAPLAVNDGAPKQDNPNIITLDPGKALKPATLPMARWIKTAAAPIGGIGLAHNGSKLHVAYFENDNRSRLQTYDLADGSLKNTFDFDDYHAHGNLALSPDGRSAYVTNYYQSYISRIDLESGKRTDLAIDGTWAGDVWLTPDGSTLVATIGADGRTNDLRNDGLVFVNVADGAFQVTRTISLKDEPERHSLAFSPNGEHLYLATRKRKSDAPVLYEISMKVPREPRSLRFPGGDLAGLTVNATSGAVLVSDRVARAVHAIDPQSLSVTHTYDVGVTPGSLECAPDGKLLAVAAPENRAVMLLSLPDGEVVGEVGRLHQRPRDMVFSPDGKKLLISHWDDKGGVAVVDLTSMEPKPTLAFASDEDGDFEIFAGRTNGKDFTQLTVNRATDRFPRWSHDGGMLAYVTDEQGGNLICVYNLFSGARRLLAKTAIEYRPGFGPPLDWSPTRHEIAFVPDKKSISIVGASSGDVRMVLLENEFPQTEITCICWQDQNRILFAAQTPASTFSHALFSLQLDTGEVKKLLDSRTSGGYFFAPVPSPNGEKILLARRDPADEVTDLVIADGRFDRTDLQNLPGKGVMPGMTWMPDGNTIIFSAKAGATYQLFWHLLWEKTNRQITTFDGDCFDSHVMRSRWQPADDGSQGDR